MQRKIILASNSPRRIEILKKIINDFEVVPSKYEEDNTLKVSPSELVLHHSLSKGKNVANSIDNGVVISADTIVFHNKILGKPKNPEQAKEMLKTISGQTIEVFTGLAVIDVDNNKQYQDYEMTRVKMKEMNAKEIESYVKTGEPLDKAGAFGIQEKGSLLVEKIDGCYYNVMGLPIYKLSKLLEKAGIYLLN